MGTYTLLGARTMASNPSLRNLESCPGPHGRLVPATCPQTAVGSGSAPSSLSAQIPAWELTVRMLQRLIHRTGGKTGGGAGRQSELVLSAGQGAGSPGPGH